MFRKLTVNIPLADALANMPNYGKFMKKMSTKKKKFKKEEVLRLSESSSTMIQRKLPLKKKDPGSFIVPYTIEEVFF